jgi:hypothetical protein
VTVLRGHAEVARLRQRLRADLAKYLCVLVSGFFEKAVQELAIDWCRRQSTPTVSRYASTQLQRLQNVQSQRLRELLGAFDDRWRDEIEGSFEEELTALSSVYGNRHQIAHGENVDITMVRVRAYYTSVQSLVAHLEKQFAP